MSGAVAYSTSDEQLAEVVRNRDQSPAAFRKATESFEQLYLRHSRLLLGFLATRVSGNDLEDVHQTVWQKIWQHLPGQFQGGRFRAWMHQIARNHLIDLSRKKRPAELEQSVDVMDEGRRPEDPLEDGERQQILSRCLETLQDEMAAIVRYRLSGSDYQEICDHLNIEPARAHKLFFQARQQLTGCVEMAMQ